MNERTYSTSEAAALLDLRPSEVRGFARAGLDSPDRTEGGAYRFGFRDLAVLRVAAALRHAEVPRRRIEDALEDLRRSPEPDAARRRLEALGEHVVVREGEVVWRADSGQLQLPLDRAGGETRLAGERPADDPARAEEAFSADASSLPEIERDRSGPGVDALLERAIDLEEDDPERAIACYREAIAADPERWEARAGLGFVLQETGRVEEAIDAYRAALELEPDATVAFNLGVALERVERMAGAAEAYERALELDPGLAEAHLNLADLAERAGDRPAALRHMIAYRDLAGG